MLVRRVMRDSGRGRRHESDVFAGRQDLGRPGLARGVLAMVEQGRDAVPAVFLSGSMCATSGPIAGISEVAAANGRVVPAVSVARGGDRAALIALMTGLTESGLRVLANPNDRAGNAYAHEGVGSDHDSLGIFQQRPSWGGAAQRMEPVASTNIFLNRLLSMPDWQAVPPWQAAQWVQASAFADGSNYRAQVESATSILNAAKADSAERNCGGSGIGQRPPGPIGQYGLPVGYTVPVGTSSSAVAAVTFVLGELGKPYVFGANGPAAYDCSSLMVAAWAAGGHALTRTTYTQIHDGTATTEPRISPGDLVLTPGSDGTLASPGHVGMFHRPRPGGGGATHRRCRESRDLRIAHRTGPVSTATHHLSPSGRNALARSAGGPVQSLDGPLVKCAGTG